jgi:hypothetical protein
MTTETDVMWLVQVLRKWESLTVLGLPLNANQLPGCVGFLPVFSTLEAAQTWRDEEHPDAGIVAMAPSSQPQGEKV